MKTPHPHWLPLLSAIAVVAALAAAAVSAAPDRKPPRLVAAAMLDRDRDARADGVRLTYSEPVRHALDRDGRYPFRVAGYRIRSVGKASGKTILLTLAERATADAGARPTLSYRRTRAGAVSDRARNQAVAQRFRATRAHGNKPTQPTPPAPTPTPTDRDGDGTPDLQDCAPDNPAIPNAADEPDLTFTDTNCDGIDGDESKAIFVSPNGNDGNPGTRALPKREIDAAVVAAAGSGKAVLAAAGSYRRVRAATGVGIYGGYDPKTWKRGLSLVTHVEGESEGVYAFQDRNVVLQLLTIVGRAQSGPGGSAYGIRAVNGSLLALQRVTVRAGNGARGADGVPGATGSTGQDGGPGGRGDCDGENKGSGGLAGSSPAGRPGGAGGDGGTWNLSGKPGKPGTIGTPGGTGGAGGNPGKSGRAGTPGAPGAAGMRGIGGTSTTVHAGQAWQGRHGDDGVNGQPGMGGGGGGGGGGQHCVVLCGFGSGNGGGGGGGGAGGGLAGRGGRAGGGSFGLYLQDSAVTVANGSSIAAGSGAAGGTGGHGGLPGPPGLGGKGADRCTGEIGAGGNGGNGGPGGPGGGGGGGAGGPSIGVLKLGTSTATLTGTTITIGIPGAGGSPGAFGSGGTPAQAGLARSVHP